MRISYNGKCPLCGGDSDGGYIHEADCSGHPMWVEPLPRKITWLQCSACEHIHTDGYWSPEALKLILERTHTDPRAGINQVFNPAKMEQERHIAARMVDRVMAGFGFWQPDNARWLDIGCGNGALLLTAAEYGFHPIGTDLRQATVDALTDIGMEVYCNDIKYVAESPAIAPSAVVSMADVLEHMAFPAEALGHARALTKTGGLLFISCPNAGAPLWEVLTANGINPYLGELEHHHNFTSDRLRALLVQAGFKPLSYHVSERYRCGGEIVARAV